MLPAMVHMSPIRRAAWVVPAASLALSLCGCEALFDALTSNTQAVSVLTRTPDLANAEGLEQSELRDALPLAQLEADATGVVVAIAHREDPLSLEAPQPIEDADVSVSWDSNTVELCAGPEAGTYLVSSLPGAPCSDDALTYAPGVTYTTVMVVDGEETATEIEAPTPLAAADVSFNPTLEDASDHFGAVLPAHGLDTALTVDWSTTPGAGSNPVFVTLFRMQYTGGAGAADALDSGNWSADPRPVYDSMSRDPAELISLVLLNEAPTDAEIPASAFDTAGVYVLVVTSTALNTGGDGLALGSGAMAGVGTAFMFWVD